MLCLAGTAASALEFRTAPLNATGPVIVTASGAIVPGDAARLQRLLDQRADRRLLLAVSSGGGSVNEGGALADIIRAAGLPVLVPAGALCASACFMLFAASPERVVGAGAKIGVHSAANDLGVETSGTQSVTIRMARYVGQFGVPDSIIGRMVRNRPHEMAWLGRAELAAMGVRILPPKATLEALDEGPEPRPQPPDLSEMEPPGVDVPRAPGPAERRPRPDAALLLARAAAQSGSFQQGLRDRLAWQAWLDTRSDAARAGAEFWVVQRRLPAPRGCTHGDPEFQEGCLEAGLRLASPDFQAANDGDYRRGWNSL